MSYGMDWWGDWLVNRGTIWFTVHTTDGTGACQNEGHLFSSYASTENQNGLFHTHKFNPKMLCHCRGLTIGRRKKKETTDQIKRASPSNIYSRANKNGRHYGKWDNKHLKWVIVRTMVSNLKDETPERTCTMQHTLQTSLHKTARHTATILIHSIFYWSRWLLYFYPNNIVSTMFQHSPMLLLLS